jgi:O-antigen ligase
MIFFVALFFTVSAICLLFVSGSAGVLASVTFRPVIDASWGDYFFGMNCLRLIGVAFPTLVLFRFLFLQRERPDRFILLWAWALYLCLNMMSLSISVGAGEVEYASNVFFRLINGFVGFYVFAAYFNDKKTFRWILLAYIIAGLFPTIMGLYQAATGQIFRERYGAMGLTRHVGIYHNAMNFKHYGYMTISSILLYWRYFSRRSFVTSLLWPGYILACLVVIHKCYSKAAYFTLGMWFFIWLLYHKKYLVLLISVMVVLIVGLASGNRIFKEIEMVYSKETAVLEGEAAVDKMFSGRVGGWKRHLERFSEAPLLNQLFGIPKSWGGGHNDYLRSLMASGFFGLMSYLLLLSSIGIKLVVNFLKHRSSLSLMGLLIYLAWMVDTVGSIPGLYPSYQWYVWGFIGVILAGVKGLEVDQPMPKKGFTIPPNEP